MKTSSRREREKRSQSLNGNAFGRKEVMQSFFRSFSLDASWNYERLQNLAFAYAMIPILKKVCKTKEQMAAALKRHLEFFSTTPHIGSLLVGILGMMESENAEREDFEEGSINAVKSSLMGPVAAVGDPLIWGSLRVTATGVAVFFSLRGSLWGPVIFLLVINGTSIALRWKCLMLGVRQGTAFLQDAGKSGIMGKISYGASVLGLVVIGSLTASVVQFPLPMESAGAMKILPLIALMAVYMLLGKNVKTNVIFAMILVLSVLHQAALIS